MTHTPASLIAFESKIRDHFAAGEIPSLIHLSGGNEEELLAIFRDIRPQDWVFSTHRNHYHALLKGIDPARLEGEILAGRSMFIYSREHNFITSSILAGTCCIAAGVAWSLKVGRVIPNPPPEPTPTPEHPASDLPTTHYSLPATSPAPHVYCFLGDGAEENGHFYEAVLFSEANDLPITFIIEDNARQVDTPKHDRRGAKATTHFPLDHFHCVARYQYLPTFPHGGAGLPPGSVSFKPEAIDRLRVASSV